MDTVEAIENIKGVLAELKATGKSTMALTALEEYLDELKQQAGESAEATKVQYQGKLALYDAQVKQHLEMFESVLDTGREALNS